MTTFQDCSVGAAVESTYATPVTVTRWFEFLEESLDFSKNIVQGKGLRVSSRVARSARRVVTTADAGGDLSMECLSKGMGILWQACLGSGSSALVSGTTYQQLFTLGDVLPSLTVQKGLPRVDGTVDAYTLSGTTVDSWELEAGNADIAKLTMTMDAKDVTTATAYAAPSYASGANLFHFANGSLSTGAFTAPTSTALAAGGTALANIRSAAVKLTHNPDTERYNFGAGGRKAKPSTGTREITGSLEAEYDSATFRDAVLNETPMCLILNYTGGALSTGTEQLQIVLPEIKLDGKLPNANGGQLITQSLEFTALDNLTAAQPIWVVVRTADTAL
ncbi:phage tail tube protein [Oryzobacter sp. R7]|uniref:phage tail tube protein n=1 Tax=Oryzobacter faecalis TaxID=3388656 RepID=UPI00398CCC4D